MTTTPLEMRASKRKNRVLCWAILLLPTMVFAQNEPDPTDRPPTAQETVVESLGAFFQNGFTPEELETWQQQNTPLLEAARDEAVVEGQESALEPLPVLVANAAPPQASPVLKDSLSRQTRLLNLRAGIHNQLLAALPEKVTPEELKQFQANEDQQFKVAAAPELAAQSQNLQTLTEEAARTTLAQLPPLDVPAGVGAEERRILTNRDRLLRSWIQLTNQKTRFLGAVKQQADLQWQQKNAALIEQITQDALNQATDSNPTAQ